MSHDKQSKNLERVRALLAKAADPGIPREEADLFRQKADELMTRYAIDAWQIEQTQYASDKRPEPEKRNIGVRWRADNPFSTQLSWMFDAVARHCRCIAPPKISYSDWTKSVFGLPSDLDWFDMLFTDLMLELIKRVDPQPDNRLSMEENMALMREAGMPWEPAIKRLISAGIIEGPYSRAIYETSIRAYRAWCKRTGHPQNYVNQRTFRRNFASGFADEISYRLRRIQRETRKHYDDDHQAGSMEVALRDMNDVIQEAVYVEYPDLRPHPADCDCDQCHRCADPDCMRLRCKAARQPMRSRSASQAGPKIDWAARRAGEAAAQEVNLSNSPSERIGGRKQLPS